MIGIRAIPLIFVITLSACGGGGGGGSDGGGRDSDNNEPSNRITFFMVEVGENPNQLAFSWSFDGDAAAFRLELDSSPIDVNGDGEVDDDDLIDGNANQRNVPVDLIFTDLATMSFQIVALDDEGDILDTDASLPNLTLEALIGYIKASDTGGNANFGISTALSADGDTMAIGASHAFTESTAGGAVYVFARTKNGAWSQQAKIRGSNTESGDEFGASISLSADGNTLAVGARGEDGDGIGVNDENNDNAENAAGAVYIFTRSDDAWEQEAYVKASNTDIGDFFGWSVALSGDGETLAVGAPWEDSASNTIFNGSMGGGVNNGNGNGAVYIFSLKDSGWVQQSYIKSANNDDEDIFGSSVALSADGDVLAVGSPLEDGSLTGAISTVFLEEDDDNDAMDSGAVYVFTREDDIWVERSYIKASNTDPGDRFGTSLALADNASSLAVGAEFQDGDIGAVYVFTQDDGSMSWGQQGFIKAASLNGSEHFGFSLDLSGKGNILAVGAYGDAAANTGIIDGEPFGFGVDFSGAVFIFTRSLYGEWDQSAYVKPPITEEGDNFGFSVALSGDGHMLAVGAPEEDSSATGINGSRESNEAEGSGAVFLY